MPTGRMTISGSVGGMAINSTISRTASGSIGNDPTVAAAKTGELTNRTDDDTGVATMDAGHGFATSDKLDVYWGGDTPGKRLGMDATVAGDAVTIDGGAGDNLPALNTDLVVMKQVNVDVDFVGNLLVWLTCFCAARASIVFYSAANAILHTINLTAGESYNWIKDTGFTNPLAGVTVAYARVSHDDSTKAQKIAFPLIFDSV